MNETILAAVVSAVSAALVAWYEPHKRLFSAWKHRRKRNTWYDDAYYAGYIGGIMILQKDALDIISTIAAPDEAKTLIAAKEALERISDERITRKHQQLTAKNRDATRRQRPYHPKHPPNRDQ